jgi:hypothetical protein
MNEDEIKALWKRLHKIRIQMDESWINGRILMDAQDLIDEIEGHMLRCGAACNDLEQILCNDFPEWAKPEWSYEGGEE